MRPPLRDRRGIGAIEIKSGATIASDYFTSLNRVAGLIPDISARTVVYGGDTRQSRTDADAVPLDGLRGVLDRFKSAEVSPKAPERRQVSDPWSPSLTEPPLESERFAARRRLVLSHAGAVADGADQRVGRRCLGRAFS